MNEKLIDKMQELVKNLDEGNYGLIPDYSGGKQYAAMEKSVKQEYPGIEVAITHQLAPRSMKLTISSPPKDEGYGLYEKEDFKYIFSYRYLDLNFTIKTYDDSIAAKLYPFFNEEQKTQIMAMTLGSKAE